MSSKVGKTEIYIRTAVVKCYCVIFYQHRYQYILQMSNLFYADHRKGKKMFQRLRELKQACNIALLVIGPYK